LFREERYRYHVFKRIEWITLIFLKEFDREVSYSPPPLPPPSEHQPPAPLISSLQKPSLPEPEGPPPPPPIQNGYAFTASAHYTAETQLAMNTLKRQAAKQKQQQQQQQQQLPQPPQQPAKPKEPIYESIRPRPDPVGGSGNSPPKCEYGGSQQYRTFQQIQNNIPPPAAGGGSADSVYGFGEAALLQPPAPPLESNSGGDRQVGETYRRRKVSIGGNGGGVAAASAGMRVSQPTQVTVQFICMSHR
jgi:hypothetical protein